ncbi:MAG TPA: hypothetical protein VIM20_12120 [Candidatus Limnocylindrales bacterium]
MADLAAVEGRLRSILDPYGDKLGPGSVYGVETLTRPGASAHDFFAAVKPGSSYVSLYLKPVYTWPQLLEGISPGLRKRLQGSRTAFSFAAVDEELFSELAALTARAFQAYVDGGVETAAARRDPSA